MKEAENRFAQKSVEAQILGKTSAEIGRVWGYFVWCGVLYLVSVLIRYGMYCTSWIGREGPNTILFFYGFQGLGCLFLLAVFFWFRKKLRRASGRLSEIFFDLCGILLTWIPSYQVMRSIGGIWGSNVAAVGGDNQALYFTSFLAVFFLLGSVMRNRRIIGTAVILAVLTLILEGSGVSLEILDAGDGGVVSIGIRNLLIRKLLMSSIAYRFQMIISFSDILMTLARVAGLIGIGIVMRNHERYIDMPEARNGDGGSRKTGAEDIPPFSPQDNRDYE